MAQDPAFLLYSKDWLQGTAQMSAEEKGVYIDLLCHQHQDNGLPASTKRLARLSGMPEIEFLKIWEYLEEKFFEKDGKLFNKKLTNIINERVEHGEMRTIIGTFGRHLKDTELSEKCRDYIRKNFNYKNFIEDFQQNQQNLSKSISKFIDLQRSNWQLTAPNHGDGDGDGDYIINNGSICFKMFEIFKKLNLEYPEDKKADYTSLLGISNKICKAKNIEQHQMLNGKMVDVLNEWQEIVYFIVSDKWFSTRSLSDINNEWQRLIQSKSNKNNNGNKSSNGSDSGEKLGTSAARIKKLKGW